MPDTAIVARLLSELEGGRRDAYDELFALVYEELRRIAHAQRRRFGGYPTLNTTALVHEAYVKLAGPAAQTWTSKPHFLAVAAKAIRQILLNYARDQSAQKRGGQWRRTTLDGDMLAMSQDDAAWRAETLIALDGALSELARNSERLSRIVECRFFGGMTIEQTAAALDISTATVTRGWVLAQAWLHRELGPGTGAAP